MCGIFGYIGSRNATPILIKGLERLEYRGYDSAGIALLDTNQLIFKTAGRLEKLREVLEKENPSSSIGIAHTRWATHGGPNKENAHPHFDSEKKIAVVHNGIIENYKEIKTMLVKEGFKFNSETDSEVLAHLIAKFYEDSLEAATRKALALVKGTFGIAVTSVDENLIVVAKRSSPLVIGIGTNEHFIASDPSAIIEHTKKVIHLEDNDVAIIKKDSYDIKHLSGKQIERVVETTDWDLEELEKKGYPHFMLKEIMEQPDAIRNTLRGRLVEKEVTLGGLKDFDFHNIKRITMIACGTSWHACLVGEYIFEKYLRIPVEVEYASEFRYRDPLIGEGDLVIAVSQSGETADTLAAIEEAKKKGARTLGIVNAVGSTIARKTDCGVYLHAGPEIGVASTKAFTCQVVAMHLINLYLGRKLNLIEEKDSKMLMEGLRKLPELVEKNLTKEKLIKEIADRYSDIKNFLYLGRGINFPLALEGALKLKEISYIHAEGYPAAEMKHGPIALIDEQMAVVFIANKRHDTYDKIISNMEEVKSRNGKIITIASYDDNDMKKLTKDIIPVSNVVETISPLINVIPMQLLAYHIAVNKGLDVDKPRNLAKSVTVE